MNRPERVFWRQRTTILALAAYGFFAVQGTRFALSPVVPNVLETFGVSKGTIGLALTVMWAAYALLQYPGGMLGDRFGERRVLLVALGLAGLGSLAVAAAPTFGLFAAFVVVLGAGAGLYFPVAASLTTARFENDGQALGIIAAGASIAGMVVPAVVAVLAVRYGWRVAVPVVGLLVVPAVGLVWWHVEPRAGIRSGRPIRSQLEPAAVRGLLGRPPVLFTLVLSIALSFTFQSVFSFLPTFLVEYRSFPIEMAGITFGGMYLLSAVGQAGMGRLSDVTSRDTAVTISTASSIAGLGILVTTPGRSAALLGVVFVGFGLSVGGVLNARFVDNFAPDERGTGLGLVRTIYLLIASSGNVITGTLADAAGWPVAYGFVIGLLGVVVAVIAANRLLGAGL